METQVEHGLDTFLDGMLYRFVAALQALFCIDCFAGINVFGISY